MIQDSRPASRLALAWAVLLPLVLTGACKEAPKAQPGSAAPKPQVDRIKKAVSGGALAPRLTDPIPAEITRFAPASAFKGPRSVGVDKQGNVYVVDTGNFRVVKLDAAGKELSSFGKQGTGPGEFSQPWKAVLSGDGNIAVLDRESNWIHLFTPDGRFVKSMAGPPMQLYFPGGLAVAPDGTMALVDTGLDRVLLLSPDGQRQGEPVKTIAGEPLKQPTDAAFDASGGLHVYQPPGEQSAALLLHRAAGGGRESKWVGVDAASTLDSARLAVGSDGRIYMTDPVQKRVVVYAADGKTVNPIKMEAAEPAPLTRLSGIALDSRGLVYVTDADANAVYRLRLRTP